MSSPRNSSSTKEDRSDWIKIHHETEKDYWWFTLKRDLVIMLISSMVEKGSTVLEIGSGGGMLSAELSKIGYNIISTDVEPASAKYTKEMRVEKVFISDCGKGIPLLEKTIDLIFMTDVLEHIEDDDYTISECVRVLKNGGYLLITVPAYPCLYSSWDRWNNHYRRYNKKMILSFAQTHNLSVLKLSHWNTLGIPFAITRKFLDIFAPNRNYEGFPHTPKFIDSTLRYLMSIENRIIKKYSIPAGLSIVCILQKKV
ncbi:MAG: class I SAM-dependent methyltransferase [Candidatus Hydrogenedentes bacterium]|nr:class I SAM-dependent methyltransferase [Candidatus Hydrogenedentota bacterium]